MDIIELYIIFKSAGEKDFKYIDYVTISFLKINLKIPR